MSSFSRPLLGDAEVDFFHANGFVHVKGVFSARECEFLRTDAALESAWADPRMVEIARRLLNAKPVFHLLTSIDRRDNEKVNLYKARKIHHDARGTKEQIFNRYHAPCDYPVIRCVVYFQDYSGRKCSGALKLSPGSHRFDTSAFDEETLPYYNVPSAPGDVVVFMKRLLHSGHSLSLRTAPDLALSPARENAELARDPGQFLPLPSLREALFIDYSDSSELADLNIKFHALTLDDPHGLAAKAGPEVFERARRAGLDLRVDVALAACCDAILKNRDPNGALRPEAISTMQRFLRLLPLAREWSAHYPLWTGLPDGPEGCLAACKRFRAYNKQFASHDEDAHMLPRVPRMVAAG